MQKVHFHTKDAALVDKDKLISQLLLFGMDEAAILRSRSSRLSASALLFKLICSDALLTLLHKIAQGK